MIVSWYFWRPVRASLQPLRLTPLRSHLFLPRCDNAVSVQLGHGTGSRVHPCFEPRCTDAGVNVVEYRQPTITHGSTWWEHDLNCPEGPDDEIKNHVLLQYNEQVNRMQVFQVSKVISI